MTATDAVAQKVLRVLSEAHQPLTVDQMQDSIWDLSNDQIRRRLAQLEAAGRVECSRADGLRPPWRWRAVGLS